MALATYLGLSLLGDLSSLGFRLELGLVVVLLRAGLGLYNNGDFLIRDGLRRSGMRVLFACSY